VGGALEPAVVEPVVVEPVVEPVVVDPVVTDPFGMDPVVTEPDATDAVVETRAAVVTSFGGAVRPVLGFVETDDETDDPFIVVVDDDDACVPVLDKPERPAPDARVEPQPPSSSAIAARTSTRAPSLRVIVAIVRVATIVGPFVYNRSNAMTLPPSVKWAR
jgi:hypothetical protein